MYTLRNQINQLFIAGYSGAKVKNCKILMKLLNEGLGGVIFFTQNIISAEQIKEDIKIIKENSLISPFLSIDQEGGKVERTENIHGGKKYKSASEAAHLGTEYIKNQTQELCEELIEYGINMNYAPVLDTNTNPNNPVIGERAYGKNPEEVYRNSKEVIKMHKEKGIIPVGKHFPGHGDTSDDSHIKMPIVRLTEEEMKNTHIKPFREAIKDGLEVIMAAHVYYTCYDKEPTPASLSKNILTNLLKDELKFSGLIISDDMVMGAVRGEDISQTYIKGLEAGINMFLYRNSDEKLTEIIDIIERRAKEDKKLQNIISTSFKKVIELKNKNKLM